ncbi:MAG: polysaccharide biosynthesis tyrosine autokinase [Chitinophagaceae bacterium]
MFRYFPYWPLFLLLMIIAGVGAWSYLKFFATPIYKTTASILVKDERKGVEDSKSMESLNVVSSKKIVENEMQVLSSKDLLKQVVKNLGLYAPVYQEGYIKPVSAYATSPIIIESQDPDNIVQQKKPKKIYFTFNKNTEQVSIGKGNSFPINQWVATEFGVLKFSKNEKKMMDADSPLFFILVNPASAVDDLAIALRVGASNKLSSVVNLSLEDEVPRRGKDILNELIYVYNLAAINDKKSLAKNTLAFLDQRISLVAKQIDSIQDRVKKFKASKGIVDMDEQSRVLIQSSGDNDRKLFEINNQISVLDEVEKYVSSQDSKSSLVPSTLGVSDPILTKLLTDLSNAEAQYDNLKRTRAENDPLLSSVLSQIEKLRPSILEALRSQRKNLQVSKASLTSNNDSYASKLQTIPENQRELLEITRQQDIKNEVYKNLLNKREETGLSTLNSAVADSKIVDAAESSILPVSPIAALVYFVAIMAALIVGIAYVSAKEFLSNKIIFRTEIEDFTSIPVIAEITHISKKNIFNFKSKKQSKIAVAEQFRQLRMALRLYRKQASKKRLLVTSSIGGEGKSFVSSNIAKSLASSGKKVVLIDFDMRNPKTSALFNLSDNSGIKEFLEEEKKIDEVLQKTEHENLYVIPAGAPAINPTELLLSSKLGELFVYLEDNFDYIIADTAPVQPVTDAYVISEFCDATLFVVRHKYTPKSMIRLLDENNKIKALKNLNIVFNGVKSRGFFNKSFGYGYGYGYEYGYGDRKYLSNRTEG